MRVALIDDDPAVVDSLGIYLKRQKFAVSCFATAEAFFSGEAASTFDCVIADVRMPGLSGLDLVRRLNEQGCATPVILITGHGDIDMAVSAIKLGAFDFIEKPFDESRLLESIRNATSKMRQVHLEDTKVSELRARFAGLSQRQRQVLDMAVAGLSNKEIASRLGISFRTVENHRAWMMERVGARNLAELVRIYVELEKA
jgi:FixJ family two-component response regulator